MRLNNLSDVADIFPDPYVRWTPPLQASLGQVRGLDAEQSSRLARPRSGVIGRSS